MLYRHLAHHCGNVTRAPVSGSTHCRMGWPERSSHHQPHALTVDLSWSVLAQHRLLNVYHSFTTLKCSVLQFHNNNCDTTGIYTDALECVRDGSSLKRANWLAFTNDDLVMNGKRVDWNQVGGLSAIGYLCGSFMFTRIHPGTLA